MGFCENSTVATTKANSVAQRFAVFVLLLVATFESFRQVEAQFDHSNKGPIWEKVTDGLNFPEGPAWNGKASLFVSNCYGGWISKISIDSHSVFLRADDASHPFDKTNGLTFSQDGSLFACDFGRGAILQIKPSGAAQIIASCYEGRRFNRPNDLAFDPWGNLYFTDPNNYRREDPDGTVYRISFPDQKVTPVANDVAFPNGIAFSPDAKHLYVCESAYERVLKFPVKADGKLGKSEVFVELPGGDPDGIAFDQSGQLYVAHFGGAAVFLLAPDGSVIRKIPVPGKRPTNLEFGDADMRTLYLTEVETNAVYKTHCETPGLHLFNSPNSGASKK